MPKAFVVGHPIAHSRSPLIHGHWLKELKLSGSYERIDVHPERFAGFVRDLARSGFVGGNVTIPHKESAFTLVDTLTERAQKIGAVNTLIVHGDGTIHGDNTDAPGFIANLEQTLGSDRIKQSKFTATILGAGGAARAIVVGLIEGGVDHIRVANRSIQRIQPLVDIDPQRIEALAWTDISKNLEKTDLLVNTTSLGMINHPPLEIDIDALPVSAAVADIVYAPLETPLLAAARQRGLATVDGLGMLLHQAVPGFEAWFGIRPVVSQHLRDLVVADLSR